VVNVALGVSDVFFAKWATQAIVRGVGQVGIRALCNPGLLKLRMGWWGFRRPQLPFAWKSGKQWFHAIGDQGAMLVEKLVAENINVTMRKIAEIPFPVLSRGLTELEWKLLLAIASVRW